jgi:CHAT domain-containing protein/tetratricopeptide (TPR) repeat protein
MPSPGRGLLLCVAVLYGFFGVALGHFGSRAITGSVVQPLAPAGPPSSAKIRSFTLAPGEARTQELAENEVHRYPFSLKAGQVLLVSIDQAPPKKDSVDVKVYLQDPTGHTLYVVDHLRGVVGLEEAHLIAQTTGLYAVDVSGSYKGAYRIELRLRSRASEVDRLLAQAEATYSQAKNLNDWGGKVKQFLAAGELWRRAGDRVRQADALQKAVEGLANQPKRETAWMGSLGKRVAELRHELGDTEREARALLFVGDAYRDLGQLDLAEREYRMALRLTERQSPASAAAPARSLGILFANRGDRYEALDYLERSERLLLAGNDPSEDWKTFEALGRAYKSLGETDKALEYFQKCVGLAKKLADKALLAKSFTRIGDVYQAQRDFKNALAFYNLSLPLHREAGNPKGEAVVRGNMGLIYRELRDFQQALRLQQEALNVFRQVGDRASQASAYCNLGLILLDGEDPIQASQNFERCAELASAQGLREEEITSFYGQAQAQRARNNPYLARLAVGKALKLIEEVGPREGIGNNLVNSRAYSYELLIDLLAGSPLGRGSRSDIEEAFEASERARWRALLDSLGRDPQRVSLLMAGNAELAARRSRLIAEIERLEDEIRRLGNGSPQAAKLKRQRTAKSRELRTLEGRLSALTSGSLKPVTVREAQQLLDRDTAVLEYYLGGHRSFLFLLTSSDLEVFVLPGRSELEKNCKEYHALISKSQAASSARHAEIVGRRVGELLLGPVAERLAAKKRLLIVPDGAIHRVPFGALPASFQGDLSQQVLLDTHEISYVPSLSVLRAIRSQVRRRVAPVMEVAVLAAPELGAESSPLPYSRKEGENVLALAPAGRRLGAFGADASRAFVLSGKLKGYRYILFSTHGEEHPDQPELSSLAVSGRGEDGRSRTDHVWLQDIKGLDLSADLVVLSACRTALGRDVPGEGSLGLPQGFLSAGSARVVVSLWDVSDMASAAVSVKLFRGVLEEKLPPPEALRAAQLAMRKSKDWSSPYYWAAFELYGEWR